MENKINIFYSWQSDLLEKTNKIAIRNMLKKAKSKVESEYSDGINILIDEATNEEIGSPNIPFTIIKKITQADVFVADITIVNSDYDGRKMPNPNVMYELGFAVSKLGWKRIILLFNKAIADVKELPFDIDRQRVLSYALNGDDEEEKVKSIIGTQSTELHRQINNILIEDPEKECFKATKTIEDIKRERDVQNIKIFLSSIQLEIIDKLLEGIPQVIIDDIFYFFNRIEYIAKSSSFHMYNQELYSLFVDYYNALSESLSHYQYYDHDLSVTRHMWVNPGDVPLDAEKQKVWDSINENRKTIRGSLNKILQILRTEYIDEIDMDVINRKNLYELNEDKKNIESF